MPPMYDKTPYRPRQRLFVPGGGSSRDRFRESRLALVERSVQFTGGALLVRPAVSAPPPLTDGQYLGGRGQLSGARPLGRRQWMDERRRSAAVGGAPDSRRERGWTRRAA